jgi:hypothetical protein
MTKRRKNPDNPFKSKAVIVAVLTASIILLMILADYPRLIERYYSEGFYLFICRILHPIFSIFPFSVGDLIYITVIVYLIYALFLLVNLTYKKEYKRAGMLLLKLVIGVQTGILIFYLFWGMNYFRPSAGERLTLRDTNYTTASLKTVTIMLIDSANATRARVTVADLSQQNDAIYKTAISAVNKLSTTSVHFYTYKPGIKPSMLTPFMNYLGTSGYYNPFTGEAQMNYEVPVFERPLIACHEMSHQMVPRMRLTL